MAQDIAIADLLTQEGFDTLPAFQTAREVLISKGLTSARKTNIHVAKLPRVREVLAGELYRACSDPLCQTIAKLECGSRQIVTRRLPDLRREELATVLGGGKPPVSAAWDLPRGNSRRNQHRS